MVTEPIDVVNGPVRNDWIDRQIGPLPELASEQATHERDVCTDLIRMHLEGSHCLRCYAASLCAIRRRDQ